MDILHLLNWHLKDYFYKIDYSDWGLLQLNYFVGHFRFLGEGAPIASGNTAHKRCAPMRLAHTSRKRRAIRTPFLHELKSQGLFGAKSCAFITRVAAIRLFPICHINHTAIRTPDTDRCHAVVNWEIGIIRIKASIQNNTGLCTRR